ncbi:MAG: LD-carboxypeptidase [Clostridia bacterium]|nr:LD-carboxypeptidase [Clostridia bacterium]MBR3485308.1 LD-carboxypeptidase [Bacteroidales bacterium]
MELIKPRRLEKDDLVATVSPCNGWAGDSRTKWKYELGASRLRELGLRVAAAPNSMRGSEYLSNNPEARAEDIMWAFDNKEVRAIIANVGGNDSIKVIPYIDPKLITDNPKIFIGYSDVMNLHLLCYRSGLSTFYGDNLLTTIADQAGWHEYSKRSFIKTLFDPSPIGVIKPSNEWTHEPSDHIDVSKKRHYYPNDGYTIIQGSGRASGSLIGGHTGIIELEGTAIELKAEDYDGAILFVEDIPEFFDEEGVRVFFEYLGQKGVLRRINGVIIGKTSEAKDFSRRAGIIRQIVSDKYSCAIPVFYGLNFGHSSPTCILPYGALAELDCEKKTFSIMESGVI